MATTIDHLETHFRYTVIRGFTDANGLKIPFEASGVISKIELDWSQMTHIHIDWERDGPGGAKTPERLTFLLAATDGPRNNHMKDYFEKGELVMPAREPRPPKPAAPTSEPAQTKPALSFARFGGKQPQEEILLDERTVACDCPPAFHRAVVPTAHLSVNACLRCGTVSVTKQVGDDGRFTGNAWTAYWAVPTDQALVDWLGAFPRVSVDYSGAAWRWPMSAALVRYPTLLYPADTRVADEEELKALEATLAEAQQPLSRAHRLGSACGDIPPVPVSLPEAFNAFGTLRRALDLRPASDIETLKAHAHLLSASCELAADLLLRREDAYPRMMEWLAATGRRHIQRRHRHAARQPAALLWPRRPKVDAPPARDPQRPAPGQAEGRTRPRRKLPALRSRSGRDRRSWRQTAADARGPQRPCQEARQKDASTADAIRLVINELNGVDNRPAGISLAAPSPAGRRQGVWK